MHEWALAESVVETVKEALSARPSGRVVAVRVVFGELQAIDPDIFRTGLRELVADGPFPADIVTIEREAASFRCERCAAAWDLDATGLSDEEREAIHFLPEASHAYLRCPECGSPDFRVEKGRGVSIRSIDIDEPEEAP